MDTTGIYIIYFDSPENCYIGQSLRVQTRLRKHKEILNSNQHYNNKLQLAFNTSKDRTFELLEECAPSELNDLEIQYVKDFNCLEQGYNLVAGGTIPIGHSSSNSKYKEAELIYLYNLIADDTLTNVDVSRMSGLPLTLVYSVAYGKRHLWLAEQYPELAKKIKEIISNKTRSTLCNDYNARNGVIYSVIDAEGIEHKFSNISHFAKANGLNRSHLNQVILGKEQQHKGWRKGVQYVI